MKTIRARNLIAAALVCALVATATFAAEPAKPEPGAGEGTSALAKAAQNPIADMISLPFQYNANLNSGPNHGTQSVLNIQPVIPFHLTSNWNLITRTIIPLISQPRLTPAQGRTNGLGDIQFSAFLSPAHPAGWNNVDKPAFASNWHTQLQVQFLFPK